MNPFYELLPGKKKGRRHLALRPIIHHRAAVNLVPEACFILPAWPSGLPGSFRSRSRSF